MSNPLEYPKLRWPIDLRIEKVDSREILLVTCPLGISPEPLGLLAAVAPIIGQFEGRLSVDEITSKFENYGVRRQLVDELIALLDQNLFMESPRFHAAERLVGGDDHDRAGDLESNGPGKPLPGFLGASFLGRFPDLLGGRGLAIGQFNRFRVRFHLINR